MLSGKKQGSWLGAETSEERACPGRKPRRGQGGDGRGGGKGEEGRKKSGGRGVWSWGLTPQRLLGPQRGL